MDSLPDDFVNGPEYASALISRFRLYGNIDDLIKADSLVVRSNLANREKEPGVFRSMASLALLQHRFSSADSLYQRALQIEGRSYPNFALEFDVEFETMFQIIFTICQSSPLICIHQFSHCFHGRIFSEKSFYSIINFAIYLHAIFQQHFNIF